jgi:hypothetical protein
MPTDLSPVFAFRTRRADSRRWAPTLGEAVAIAVIVGSALVAAASLRFIASPETASGEGNMGQFLAYWEQVGTAAASTPNPLPPVLSAAMAAPTVLPGASAALLVDTGVHRDVALTWTFQETVGAAPNTELELNFQVQYLLVGVPTVFSTTVYLETQAAAIGAPLTFTIYWDSGVASGVTFQSQLELSQACSAVGTCP